MECPHCKSKNVKFIRTRDNWYDGDEDDIYECQDCKKRFEIYIPR